MSNLDISDPQIATALTDLRADDGKLDWIILGLAPKLPSTPLDHETVILLASGQDGLPEFQRQLGTASVSYGFVKHENHVFFVEVVPDKLDHTARASAHKHGRQISSTLKSFDTELSISHPSELSDLASTPVAPTHANNSTPYVTPTQSSIPPSPTSPSLASASSDASLLHPPSHAARLNKMSNSANSLLSTAGDADQGAVEEMARRVKENLGIRERWNQEVAKAVRVVEERRAKEQQYQRERSLKKESQKEAFRVEFERLEESHADEPTLALYADLMPSTSPYWNRRYLEIHNEKLSIFPELSSPQSRYPSARANPKSIATISLRNSTTRDATATDECALPNTLIVKDGTSGVEQWVHVQSVSEFLRLAAAVERFATPVKARVQFSCVDPFGLLNACLFGKYERKLAMKHKGFLQSLEARDAHDSSSHPQIGKSSDIFASNEGGMFSRLGGDGKLGMMISAYDLAGRGLGWLSKVGEMSSGPSL
ncbi:uncharacterized protein EV422DRAFT_506232 [Fimicolochytrium jonesii]|uniref:uncharacterized protein n=1 Tax=Fimicolochytrium jonesii TaxID=1396493 RepID=UPI0022FE8414|nr:uncharacterized protein EV422DRAFT_506232 [Fimicolochytrium jonesii]KAI8821010.1 hypothetical protein EV422DRAFT_506232 [Fimicolochytrium jonesii]